MRKIKILLCSSLIYFNTVILLLGQEGSYVDKDFRIKKYQKEMIRFLLVNNQFGEEKVNEKTLGNYYSGQMGVKKYLEMFPAKPHNGGVLLVRFFSLASGSENYWGILEKDCKYFFYYNDKNAPIIKEKLKKYDLITQNTFLNFFQIFTEWYGTDLHNR